MERAFLHLPYMLLSVYRVQRKHEVRQPAGVAPVAFVAGASLGKVCRPEWTGEVKKSGKKPGEREDTRFGKYATRSQ